MAKQSNVRNKAKNAVKELWSFKFMKETLAVYIFLLFVIYPLYYEDKYYNMGEAKWNFFRRVSYYLEFPIDNPVMYIPTFLAILLAFFLWHQVSLYMTKGLKEFWSWKKTSLTDKFVLGYFISVLISSILISAIPDYGSSFSDYWNVWSGYSGWNMGLVAQLAFVAMYFFMSRYWRWDDILAMLYLGISAIVFFLGVLNRFQIDPFGMYEGLSMMYVNMFLSTMGQATWYSSYVAVMFPIGVFAYWYSEKKPVRIMAAVYCVIGFMTEITQDSDSAFYSLAAFLFVLFLFSFKKNKHFKRYLEILLIMLLSWRVIGFLQMIFPPHGGDHAMAIHTIEQGQLMLFGSQSPIMWIPIVIIGALYAFIIYKEKKGTFDVTKLKWMKYAGTGLAIVGVVGVVLYIYLNSTGRLPESLSSTNNYLYFDEFWGNNRGHSWTMSVKSLGDAFREDPMRAIFGSGPDGFCNLVYRFHGAELYEKWGQGTILTCAHNEWLNQIINIGVIGGLFYIGIFVGAIIRFAKKAKTCPEVIAPMMCIASYMAHNFFCYQQIICTPMIFIIIGAGESIARIGELRPIYEKN